MSPGFPENSPSLFENQGIEEREFFSHRQNPLDNGTDKRVADLEGHSILNQILSQLGGSTGTPFFLDAFNSLSPGNGNTVQLINATVPVGKTREFSLMSVSSKVSGRFECKINSVLVAILEVGAGQYNAQFDFKSLRKANSGDIITVDFIQTQGPQNIPISAQISGTES